MIDSEKSSVNEMVKKYSVKRSWKETEILSLLAVRAQNKVSYSVPFAEGSNKLICIASWTIIGVKKLSIKSAFKLYELDPKPEDLTMSRLKIFYKKSLEGRTRVCGKKTGMTCG